MSHFQTNPVIFAPGNALEADYREDLFVERDEQVADYVTKLEPVLHGRSPTNIFVDGERGSGKTSTTKYVLSLLEQKMQGSNRTLSTVHVSASQDSTSFQTLIKIVSALRTSRGGERLAQTGYSYDGVADELLSELDRLTGVLYIVVDEADDIRDPDKLFNHLSRLTERTDLSELDIGIIAIANDGSVLDELEPTTRSTLQAKQITFPPYNVDEIEAILRKRGQEAFIEGALPGDIVPLCAAKCSQMGGDVRDGLELLRQAGEIARVRIRDADEDSEPHVITEEDVLQAEKELTPTWLENAIHGLSDSGQRVLFAVATKETENQTPAKTSEIHQFHSSAFPLFELSKRQLRDYLRSLAERGLLYVDSTNNGRAADDPGQYHGYGLAIELPQTIEMLGTVRFHDDATAEYLAGLCETAVENNQLTASEEEHILTDLPA